jgi:2-C-methyl-D-erythritol 2,4-cyclodiphosphate synthase
VNNIDATVICEAPKLSPHTAQMCQYIAEDCQVDISQINVKATTTEKLGFTGRGEGIAAEAVCTIISA